MGAEYGPRGREYSPKTGRGPASTFAQTLRLCRRATPSPKPRLKLEKRAPVVSEGALRSSLRKKAKSFKIHKTNLTNVLSPDRVVSRVHDSSEADGGFQDGLEARTILSGLRSRRREHPLLQ